ncbi:MAG: TIGR00268 family protein, partial [Thermodesulfobacteriota bacterium]
MALESRRRYQLLIENLKGYQRVGVAFSGGVDSTLLLYAACEALGRQNVLVLRGLSALLSATEKGAGSMLLDHLQIEPERLLEVELQPLDWPEFVINDGARCYVCKKRMYQHFLTVLEGKNISVLLDGSNVDDLKNHRPGSRAIEELGVKTPLLDAGLTKKDIRT